jgi:hypothetical protein
MLKRRFPSGRNTVSEKAPKGFAEAFRNAAGIGNDRVADLLSEDGFDIGGIEPEAYQAGLDADHKEAVEDMGLSPDDDTYIRYRWLRYHVIFGHRENIKGETVVAENRATARLSANENLTIVRQVTRDIALVRQGSVVMRLPSGKLDYEEYPELGPSRQTRPGDSFGAPGVQTYAIPSRPMRPDDNFGTPGTRIYRDDLDPAEVFRSAVAPRRAPTPHTYSLSIRPGETKTQVIELPGLTLALTITMPSMLPRPV